MIVFNQPDSIRITNQEDSPFIFQLEKSPSDPTKCYMWVHNPDRAEFFLASPADLHALADWIKENVK